MMSSTVLTCGAVLLATTSSFAADREAALHARIAQLEQRLAQVEQTSDTHWLTQRRADEIKQLVHEVLADADTRASLLSSGMNAGWDDGFYLGSADGNFRLQVGGNMQYRYLYNYQRHPAGGSDRHRNGFENARTQLIFTGHVVDPSWIYRVQGNFMRDGGGFELEDAYIGKAFGNGWTFLAGQFRAPMLREFLVTEPRQQAIERSLVHEEFTAARVQGVAMDYRNDFLHFTGGFTDGVPATGGFNSPWSMRSTEYAFTGRLEGLVAGTWDQFTDFAGQRGEEFGLLLGAAAHYQQGEYGTADDELEVFQWTIDAALEFGGANLFAYVVGRHLDAPGVSLDQYGIVVQGGVFLTDDWEVFARYEWGDDDMDGPNLSVVTAGVNYFIAGHRLKWGADIGFALREVTDTWGNGFVGPGGDRAGWRADAPGEKGQVVVRSQLQLLF